jgi:hypothetical protein
MKLFFRNDDTGSQPELLVKLLSLFATYGIKLNAAVIPITCEKVYDKEIFQQHARFVQIHTHGYAYANHQTDNEEKKSEYPPDRLLEDVKTEFLSGRTILENLFPNLYFPAFTPPWNSIADKFIPFLPESGYQLLSRIRDEHADFPNLTEININFSFRTEDKRTFANAQKLWDFFNNFGRNRKTVGILLQHSQLDDADFEILEEFLQTLKRRHTLTYFLSELKMRH